MKLRIKPMPIAILQVIASGAFSVAALTPAMAQQASGTEPVQRVVVTGSLISRTDTCLLYTSPSPRDLSTSRMPSSA